MKQRKLLFIAVLSVAGVLLGCSTAEAGLKIYYIRHAEGGHNVKKAWEAKGVPRSEWPSYVGNPDVFTPKGKLEVIAATEKLKAYDFDFIASSPAWRAYNTILPYLKETRSTAEVWPELREGRGMLTILSKDIPDLHEKILNQGPPIILPEEEQKFFMLRKDAKNNYSNYPRGSDYNLKVAYMKHASLNAIDVIKKHFGGTDKSILLAGHNSAGVSLLKLLLQHEPENKRGLSNTGIWMVEEQPDGTFVLKMYNDEPVGSDVDIPADKSDGVTKVRFENLRGDLSGGEIDGLRSNHSNVAITKAADGKDVVYSFAIINKNLDNVGGSDDSLSWDVRVKGFARGTPVLKGNDSAVTLGSNVQLYTNDKDFGISYTDNRYVDEGESIQFSIENVVLDAAADSAVQFVGFDGISGSGGTYIYGVGSRGLESETTATYGDLTFSPVTTLTITSLAGKERLVGLNGSFNVMSTVAQDSPTHLVDEKPVRISEVEAGVYLVDFGRVAYGNVRLLAPEDADVTVHFGEAMKAGRIHRKPPPTVRYKAASVLLEGAKTTVVAPAKDAKNTGNRAIQMPPEWGVVLPFRWVEIEGWPGELKPEQIVRQSAFSKGWENDAARFHCSDEMLNRIWELCRYSIKATTFAGLYVDGDRERIPYEADAYLNQLSHYYSDNDIQMARDTLDYLLTHGTWPTEWAPHLVFMVHADWMRTGDKKWMAGRYEALKSRTLADRKGPDGLIASNTRQVEVLDIVDWPKGERDGYVFTARNTVVNAFHLQAIKRMAEMARALEKADEAAVFELDFRTSHNIFQQTFFDAKTGLYKDGVDTDHCSLHANLFPLAFGLAPEGRGEAIAEWIAARGMKCSVYAAQYLMEGLFENGADRQAIELVTAENDRSWRHMVESGTTITWEAWDHKYRGNQDWNHAWGAAPANLLPRYILGAQPLTPGWETALIRPYIGGLSAASGKVPTPRGPILIDWKRSKTFTFSLTLPEGMRARIELPEIGTSTGVYRAGVPVNAVRIGNRWVLELDAKEAGIFEVNSRHRP